MQPGEWVKSSFSFSNGNCVEVQWRTPRRSVGNGACLEAGNWRTSSASIPWGQCVEAVGALILVRDTRDREGAVLAFGVGAWASFTARMKRNA